MMSVDKIAEAQDTVELSVTEYEELIRRENFLNCLEACGVDGWDGYSQAVDMFQEEYPEAVED